MSLPESRSICRELGLPTTGSKKDLDKRIKDHMERNHTPPTEFTTRAILLSDFKCDSFSENTIEIAARNAIEKVADEATVDHSQEPVRWGNSQGLTVLENQDNMMMLIKSNSDQIASSSDQIASLQQKVELLESEVNALKATTDSYFAVRSRFFAVFLRDRIGKINRADQNLINEGNFAAHGGDPLTDAMMFKKRIRTDDKTFALLYGMSWARVIEYAENQPVLKVLAAHATAIANTSSSIATSKTELERLEGSFAEFIDALEDGGYQQGFLCDSQALETVMYWRFWKHHRIYQDFLSSTKSEAANSGGR